MKPTLSLTAGMLETYRRFRDTEYTTHDDLVSAILRRSEQTENMRFGNAVDDVMNKIYTGNLHEESIQVYQSGDYTFDGESIRKFASDITPLHLRQVRMSLYAFAEGAHCYVRCACDAMYAQHIIDHKATLKAIDERKVNGYHDSMQWRVYLRAFQAKVFTFNVGRWDVDKSTGLYYLADHTQVRQTAYRDMQFDIMNCLRGLVTFIRDEKLIDKLATEYTFEEQTV